MMNAVKLAAVSLFHPIEALDVIKRERGVMKGRTVCYWYGAALLARFFYILTVHYPLQDTAAGDANLLLEIAKLLGPVISWAFASYMITSILDGETTLKEVLTVTSFAYVPYFVLTPLFALLSHLFSVNDAVLYSALQGLMTAWIVLFLLIAFQRLNGYGFWKTAGVGLLSLVFMLLLWGLLLLFAALSVQAYYFFRTVYTEINLKFWM